MKTVKEEEEDGGVQIDWRRQTAGEPPGKQIPWFVTIGDPDPINDGVQAERMPIDMGVAMTIEPR